MDNKLNYREILTREPYYEILPTGYKIHRVVPRGKKVTEPIDNPMMRIITQADFLRMYYPSGHAINDPLVYPDVVRKDPETGKSYLQPIIRTAFAFQKVITTKQRLHIVGNDMQFELTGKVESDEREEQKNLDFVTFRKGWLEMEMEQRFYEFTEFKIVGDAAIVGYFDKNGRARARTLCYTKGDTLYPHRDPETGEMLLFARKYSDYDEEGKVTSEFVEIWDETFLYRAKRGIAKSKIVQRIKEVFGLAGFQVYEKKPHGFNFCPVAYFRDEEGACFLPAQSTIETYEEAFSYFCENNRAYAFPIMWSKGDGVEFKPDEITGAVKYIEITDPEGSAGFLDKNEVSAAFNTQLKLLYDLIYEQAFCVKPPELKSGDLPGVAVKLLFSPAIENAIHDCQKLQSFVSDCVRIVKYAYGFQENCLASLMNLPINAWIEPYIHQNDSELMTNLAIGVQNGFISKQTASERAIKYSRNDEIQRVLDEYVKKKETDLKFELEGEQKKAEIEVRKTEALNNASGGQDINTGQGTKTRTTDKWENHPGENNWDEWNETH